MVRCPHTHHRSDFMNKLKEHRPLRSSFSRYGDAASTYKFDPWHDEKWDYRLANRLRGYVPPSPLLIEVRAAVLLDMVGISE